MEPESFDAGDLDAMWEARTEQYVNLVKVAGENNLKLFVIKFDPSYRNEDTSYEITITSGGGPLCASCSND